MRPGEEDELRGLGVDDDDDDDAQPIAAALFAFAAAPAEATPISSLVTRLSGGDATATRKNKKLAHGSVIIDQLAFCYCCATRVRKREKKKERENAHGALVRIRQSVQFVRKITQ